jgi:hypothetical protein
VSISAFDSQLPGMQPAAAAMFGAVLTEVLVRALQTDTAVMERIKSKFPPK